MTVLKALLSIIFIANSTSRITSKDIIVSRKENETSDASLMPLDKWFARVSDPTFQCKDQHPDPGLFFTIDVIITQ